MAKTLQRDIQIYQMDFRFYFGFVYSSVTKTKTCQEYTLSNALITKR